MRRAEADAVAWFRAGQAWEGLDPEPRALGMWWTAHTSQAVVPDVLPDIVAAIQAPMRRLGRPLAADGFSVGLGPGGPIELPFTAEGLERLAELCALEESVALVMRMSAPPAPDGVLHTVDLSIEVNYTELGIWSGRLFASLGDDWLDERSPRIDAEAAAYSEALGRVCAATGAVWGCVSLDNWDPAAPPYESYFTIDDDSGEEEADQHPRGYYWSNVLSAKHIAGLGGLAVVSQRCRDLDLSAEVLSDEPGAELVQVVSPAPVSRFTDDRLAAVRDLLDPILLRRPYTWYAGPPLRVFKEPGTAFREIPREMNTDWGAFDGES